VLRLSREEFTGAIGESGRNGLHTGGVVSLTFANSLNVHRYNWSLSARNKNGIAAHGKYSRSFFGRCLFTRTS
jgi:hypothetical protein